MRVPHEHGNGEPSPAWREAIGPVRIHVDEHGVEAFADAPSPYWDVHEPHDTEDSQRRRQNPRNAVHLDVVWKFTVAYALRQDHQPFALRGQTRCDAVLPGEHGRLPIHDEVDEE